MKPEPLPETVAILPSFTPVGIDHLAILYAAGRASARTPRIWKCATLLLVLSQLTTLAFLLRRTPPEAPVPTVPASPAVPPTPTAAPVPAESSPPEIVVDSSQFLLLSHRPQWELPPVEPALPTEDVPRERHPLSVGLSRLEQP